MQVTINSDEAQTLRNMLHDHMRDLRRELAATDLPARELRAELHKRVSLCERLVAELNADAEVPR